MDVVSLLFSFRGRTTRLPFLVVTSILVAGSATFLRWIGPYGAENPMTVGSGLATIVNFVIVLWIGLAVQVKRWHDRDKSGWWALLNLVPVVGPIWILVECGVLRGTAGANRFGQESTSSSR